MTVQEYIPRGIISSLGETWPLDVWKSIALQLCFAAMQWYETHGFLHGDWHFGNVLVDETEATRLVYLALKRRWVVEDAAGVRPVITDFARSELRPARDLQPWMLASQLGMVWDMLRTACPDTGLSRQTKEAAMDVGADETVEAIVARVQGWVRNCRAAVG